MSSAGGSPGIPRSFLHHPVIRNGAGSARPPHSHSKAAPHLLARVGWDRYIFRDPELPMGAALVREYLEPAEVYEKRP